MGWEMLLDEPFPPGFKQQQFCIMSAFDVSFKENLNTY